jgi:hypothetical protein
MAKLVSVFLASYFSNVFILVTEIKNTFFETRTKYVGRGKVITKY